MTENDTIKLLRECDAGTRMGAKAIDEVIGHVSDDKLRKLLTLSRSVHTKLQEEILTLLKHNGAEGKDAEFMAKSMAHIKIHGTLAMSESDATVASLISDGCSMGVKSLTGYLNAFSQADEKSRDIARRLIELEERLIQDIKPYLLSK